MIDQRLLAIGAYINSALYCVGVFVAGVLTGNLLAWRLALVTVGVNFLFYFAQLAFANQMRPSWLLAGSGLTIVIGFCAGVVLL